MDSVSVKNRPNPSDSLSVSSSWPQSRATDPVRSPKIRLCRFDHRLSRDRQLPTSRAIGPLLLDAIIEIVVGVLAWLIGVKEEVLEATTLL